MSDFESEVKFLIDRLRQFESENMDEESFRDWNGHIAPSIARLEMVLESQDGEVEPVENWWKPEQCPITKMPFFMWIKHPDDGWVPTYGGPYDSYTLPEFDGDSYTRKRFDHDEGAWLLDEVEDLGIQIVDDQLYVSEDAPANTHPPAPTQGVPEGYILMPESLTAERGAKHIMSGEFQEVVELECTACDEDDEDCEVCSGNGSYTYRVPVSWTTIKNIYKLAADKLSAPSHPSGQWVRCDERLPEEKRPTRKTPNGILIVDENGRIERLREVTETTINYMKNGPRMPKKFEHIAGPKIIAWIDLDEWELPTGLKPQPPNDNTQEGE